MVLSHQLPLWLAGNALCQTGTAIPAATLKVTTGMRPNANALEWMALLVSREMT
jgi:hypothetical protein